VKVGAAATIHLDAYPDWEIPGSVIAIIPTADQKTKGTVQVRIAIKSKDGEHPAANGGRGDLHEPHASRRANRRAGNVPLDAVRANGRTGTVFLIGAEDTVEKREVALGLKSAQSVVILSGVARATAWRRESSTNCMTADKVKNFGMRRVETMEHARAYGVAAAPLPFTIASNIASCRSASPQAIRLVDKRIGCARL